MLHQNGCYSELSEMDRHRNNSSCLPRKPLTDGMLIIRVLVKNVGNLSLKGCFC